MITTSTALASHAPTDGTVTSMHKPGPNGFKPSGRFGRYPYFDCPADIFRTAYKGRRKGERWSKVIGDSEWARCVRQWAKINKNPDFLIRNKETGHFLFLNRGVQTK